MNSPELRASGMNPRISPGTPPGTLSANAQAIPSRIQVICYGPDDCSVSEPAGVESLGDCLERWPVVWVNVDGLADVDMIADLGRLFKLHHLALEL